MPKVMKTCRVCGKPYEACRTVSKAIGVFRWQDVACSPECGAIYLQKLNESRGITVAPVAPSEDHAVNDLVHRPPETSRTKRSRVKKAQKV